jgi:hypothetical protein
MEILPKILGAIGLLLITAGVLRKSETQQDILFIVGSAGLLVYSISLRDPIFIPLQTIFILVTGFELWKLSSNK